MYSNLPNLVLGFHGCDEETYKKVLYNHEPLLPVLILMIGSEMEYIFGKTVFPGRKNGQ